MTFENCEIVPVLSSKEDLLSQLAVLADGIRQQEGQQFGIGVWSGNIKSNSTAIDYGDSHIALFGERGLITPILETTALFTPVLETTGTTSDSLVCLVGLILQNSHLLKGE